jgi:hypothetical protein
VALCGFSLTIIVDHINTLNAELNPICHLLALVGSATIVDVSRLRVKCVILTHLRRLMELRHVPRTPFGRASLGDDGDANKLFVTYLFSDMDLDIQFLKDVGLIGSKVTCDIRHRAPLACLPYPTRASVQSYYDRVLRPVL